MAKNEEIKHTVRRGDGVLCTVDDQGELVPVEVKETEKADDNSNEVKS